MENIQQKPTDWNDEILSTKINIPYTRTKLLQRERLADVMRSAAERKVVLLVAPTGYGKTTFLSRWFSELNQNENRVVWLSLDQFDNTIFRFWSYIAAGFQKADRRMQFNPQVIFRQEAAIRDNGFLVSLMNEINRSRQKYYLVLDDYQMIHNETIHHNLEYLVEYQPENLHIVIASRSKPPINLGRLRAQGQLLEINEAEMSFSQQETRIFLSSVMGLPINREQIDLVYAATEGWIAGLQLSALTLQHQPIRADVFKNWQGDNRQIFDYLTEEVLQQQPPELQDFLLKTSTMPEISAKLCDFALDRHDSQALLDRALAANLFLMPIDRDHTWYRYHPLFADTLEAHLQNRHPELIQPIHNKACTWLRENGFPNKAVYHAVAVEDFETASEIVDEYALRAVIDFDLKNLIYWVGLFSPELLQKHPRLGIYEAIAYYQLGQDARVESSLRWVEATLKAAGNGGVAAAEVETLTWEVDCIRASMFCLTGDTATGIPTLKRLMETAPDPDSYIFGFAAHCLAETYDITGDLPQAEKTYLLGCEIARKKGFHVGYVHSSWAMARLIKLQGRLDEANQIYHSVMDYARLHQMDAGAIAVCQLGITEINLERNNPAPYQKWVDQLAPQMDLLQQSALVWVFVVRINLWMARYYLMTHRFDLAMEYCQKVLGNPFIIDYLIEETCLIETQILACLPPDRQKFQAVREVIQRPYQLPNLTGGADLVLARLDLLEGNSIEAVARMRNLLNQALPFEVEMDANIVLAVGCEEQGIPDQADAALEKAVRMAAQSGYLALFLFNPRALEAVVERLAARDISEPRVTAHARKILAMLRQAGAPARNLPGGQNQPDLTSALEAGLTSREVEVVRMLLAGKSAKEISTDLSVSINTAKAHIKNIYKKCDVHNRRGLLAWAKTHLSR
jgi:LuxR family maltose regulon positive regulatory protein